MANTFTQLHIQFVFAVQNRISLIDPAWETELFKYITGIVQNHKHKMIAIGGMPDHLHVFVGLHPTQSISNLMQIVKGESSEWVNKKGFAKGKFQWQEGYGAFSYGHSQVNQVYNYVMNQKEHHKKRSFLDEYKEFLKRFEVPFDERYIFKALA
ncbi:MAG: IS200/IS605 family transposase [Cyclobacteriaceae bacterium]|nr:IS200/IS605 family transposase [Cyclobacteriaceae bacterium]MDH4297183.1 IS200/IS605 family transposase [Cyclobacteriaceae bacterium]MDH5250799.1 IS200/IS605 family transposase [Cyclobacteriaceae bacterium]